MATTEIHGEQKSTLQNYVLHTYIPHFAEQHHFNYTKQKIHVYNFAIIIIKISLGKSKKKNIISVKKLENL